MRQITRNRVPRHKAESLNFMKATTEHSAGGTWLDPRRAANDMQAHYVVLEAEYGEIDGELIGCAIAVSFSLIKNLLINEGSVMARRKTLSSPRSSHSALHGEAFAQELTEKRRTRRAPLLQAA